MSLKMKPADWILIVLLCAGALAGLGWSQHGRAAGKEIEIYNAEGLFMVVPLEKDAEIRVPGPLGECVVAVSNGKVRMQSSPCPNQICVDMGEISLSGENIVCVPNRVSIKIRGDSGGIDAVAY